MNESDPHAVASIFFQIKCCVCAQLFGIGLLMSPFSSWCPFLKVTEGDWTPSRNEFVCAETTVKKKVSHACIHATHSFGMQRILFFLGYIKMTTGVQAAWHKQALVSTPWKSSSRQWVSRRYIFRIQHLKAAVTSSFLVIFKSSLPAAQRQPNSSLENRKC